MATPLPKVLNLADTDPYPGVLGPLDGMVEILTGEATEAVLARLLPECEGYLASLHVRLNRELIQSAPNLKVVATPSTGWDHLDVEALAERDIKLISLRESPELLENISATAEMAWGLLLSVVRQIPWSFQSVQEGQWGRDEFRGRQLSGLTLGICGYGRLGRMVAEYGRAFRMRVLVCDVKPMEVGSGTEQVDFQTLLRASDVVTIHIHLTESNRHLFGPQEFALMKPGAILLNTSRGAIVDEQALLHSLQSGHLGGAGLDVIDGEWDRELQAHPLIAYSRNHKNVVISPHTGGVTFESQRMVYAHTVRKLADFFSGG